MSRITRKSQTCRVRGAAATKSPQEIKKKGVSGKGNEHLDSYLDHLWCDKLRLIGFPVHTHAHRELICVTPQL